MDTIKLRHGIWVLVADGEKALLLKNVGDNKFPNLEVVQVMEQENPPTREQGSDSPGRYNDGPSVHRSAVEDTDWHRIGKERFAEEGITIVLVTHESDIAKYAKRLVRFVDGAVVHDGAVTHEEPA